VLAHEVSKVPAATPLTSELLEDLRRMGRLPEPLERVDLLVRHLATEVPVGRWAQFPPERFRARLGCEDDAAVKWVVAQAEAQGYLSMVQHDWWVLSLAGWQRHAALTRAGAGSRHAFMAMKFGDAELDRVLREHLQPAVAATGFELRTTAGPHQTAGSIDDRMRVEIRTSRFLVCELTHGNRGAYWEAGFAEGLGRPVFYLCRRDALQGADPERRPHFDTAHQLILPWHPDTMAEDMAALKAAIRATLPSEARMED
jgi:hypothetical protein